MSDIFSVVLDLKGMVGGGIQDVVATASFSVERNDTSIAAFATPVADSEGIAQMQQPHIDLSFLQMSANAWQQELDDTTKGLQLFGKTLNGAADQTTRFYGTRGELLNTSWGDTSTATATFGVPKDDLVGELLPELLFILMDIESNLSQLPEILRTLLSSLDALRGVLGGTQLSIIGLTNVLNDMSPSVQQLPEQLKGLQKTLDGLPKKIQAAIKAAKEDKSLWEKAKDLIDDIEHIKKIFDFLKGGGQFFKNILGTGKTVTELGEVAAETGALATDAVAGGEVITGAGLAGGTMGATEGLVTGAGLTEGLLGGAGVAEVGTGLAVTGEVGLGVGAIAGSTALAATGIGALVLLAGFIVYQLAKDDGPRKKVSPPLNDTKLVRLPDGKLIPVPINAEEPTNYQGQGHPRADIKVPDMSGFHFPWEKKPEKTVKPVTDAIINGGNRVININMNAPMYKVDHQVFQKAEDAIKDFEPKLKEALLRILYSVPAV